MTSQIQPSRGLDRVFVKAAIIMGMLSILAATPLYANDDHTSVSAPVLAILGCDPTPDGLVINLAHTNLNIDPANTDHVDTDNMSRTDVRCLPLLARLVQSLDSPPSVSVARLRAVDSTPRQSDLVWVARKNKKARFILGCTMNDDALHGKEALVVRFFSTLRHTDFDPVGKPCYDVLTGFVARSFRLDGPITAAFGRNADGSTTGRGLAWSLTQTANAIEPGLAKVVQCNLDDAGNLVTRYLESSDPDISAWGVDEPCLATLARQQNEGGSLLKLSAAVPVPVANEDCLIFDLGGGNPGGGGSNAPCCPCAPVCACGLCP